MLNIAEIIRQMLLLAGYMNLNEAFPEPLPKQEEERLILLLCEKGDEQARNKLIEHNLRLVSHIAKKYINTGEDLDELITIGSIGLVKAISTFRPEKGALSAYASRCIENEIRMYLRQERRRILAETSLEEPVGRDSDGNEVTVGDRLSSDDDDVQESAFLHIFREKLKDAMDSVLDDRERKVIELRYSLCGSGSLAQREVASLLGVSRSYISRIEKRALKKLNDYIENGH